jgi:hypothetical protein
VRSLNRAASVMTVARELATYRLDLLDVQEVRWDIGGTVRVEDHTFLLKRKRKSSVRDTIFVDQIIILAVKTAEFLVIGCHI